MATLITVDLNLINNHWSICMNKLISIYINNGVSLFEQGDNTVIIPIELSNDIIDILEYLNNLYPLELAMDWDNSGFLLGKRDADIKMF